MHSSTKLAVWNALGVVGVAKALTSIWWRGAYNVAADDPPFKFSSDEFEQLAAQSTTIHQEAKQRDCPPHSWTTVRCRP